MDLKSKVAVCCTFTFIKRGNYKAWKFSKTLIEGWWPAKMNIQRLPLETMAGRFVKKRRAKPPTTNLELKKGDRHARYF